MIQARIKGTESASSLLCIDIVPTKQCILDAHISSTLTTSSSCCLSCYEGQFIPLSPEARKVLMRSPDLACPCIAQYLPSRSTACPAFLQCRVDKETPGLDAVIPSLLLQPQTYLPNMALSHTIIPFPDNAHLLDGSTASLALSTCDDTQCTS